MKYFAFTFLSLYLCVKPFIIHSQNVQLTNQADTISGERISFDKTLILNDEQEILFSGKVYSLINCTFTRHLKIKVTTPDAAKRLSKIKIPYSPDPIDIIHAPEKRNQGFFLDKIKINSFTLKVYDSNDHEKPISYSKNISETFSTDFYDNRYDTYYSYYYTIEGLKPGDLLDINYQYTVPFAENLMRLASFRIFFHDSIPKRKLNLRLQIDDNIVNAIKFINGGEPDSVSSDKSSKIFIWNKSNLPGCIKETGSRPYLTLPYVIVNITPVDMYYRTPYTVDLTAIPTYIFPVYYRQLNHLNIVRSVSYGSTRKQFLGLNFFIDSLTSVLPDDGTGYNRLLKIQNFIAEEFRFDDDVQFFRRIENSDGDLGQEAQRKVLKDIHRNDFYVAIVTALKLGYFTAYPVDIRSGEISQDYVTTMFSGDYLITPLLKDNKIHFIYPKSSRFGFFLDELPFFFENVKIRLIHLDDYCDYKKPYDKSFREIRTPKTSINENLRITRLNAFIDIDSGTVDIEAKVTLSGQFSTLGRAAYLYNIDIPTVNKSYSNKIWKISSSVVVRDSSIKVLTNVKPYTTEIKASFSSNSMLTKHDSVFNLSMKNCLPYIAQEGVDSNERVLDYYSDFQFREDYQFELIFNKDIELVKSIKEVYIWNSFGKLTFIVKQKNPRVLSIQSSNLITADKVDPSHIADVKKIFDQIKYLSEAYILVKPK